MADQRIGRARDLHLGVGRFGQPPLHVRTGPRPATRRRSSRRQARPAPCRHRPASPAVRPPRWRQFDPPIPSAPARVSTRWSPSATGPGRRRRRGPTGIGWSRCSPSLRRTPAAVRLRARPPAAATARAAALRDPIPRRGDCPGADAPAACLRCAEWVDAFFIEDLRARVPAVGRARRDRPAGIAGRLPDDAVRLPVVTDAARSDPGAPHRRRAANARHHAAADRERRIGSGVMPDQ